MANVFNLMSLFNRLSFVTALCKVFRFSLFFTIPIKKFSISCKQEENERRHSDIYTTRHLLETLSRHFPHFTHACRSVILSLMSITPTTLHHLWQWWCYYYFYCYVLGSLRVLALPFVFAEGNRRESFRRFAVISFFGETWMDCKFVLLNS